MLASTFSTTFSITTGVLRAIGVYVSDYLARKQCNILPNSHLDNSVVAVSMLLIVGRAAWVSQPSVTHVATEASFGGATHRRSH
ncbi:hypothetical protein [Halocatena salina]|uniref:Uncharacterized protein n=1 Tax=Halocatena salina TaxID=2934340 RepID=A0A8U0A5Q8_9EURY|nr:hypothetical protein [Halocatena salina]UPM44521.1 hypothetical protein MW046_13910 [Halocatena salina]